MNKDFMLSPGAVTRQFIGDKMGKCAWEDGKFNPCEKFDWHIIEYNLTNGGKMRKCFHCKADIRTPKEKPDKIYLLINGEKFVIDFDDTAEKVEKIIAEIIKRKTGILAKVEARRGK